MSPRPRRGEQTSRSRGVSGMATRAAGGQQPLFQLTSSCCNRSLCLQSNTRLGGYGKSEYFTARASYPMSWPPKDRQAGMSPAQSPCGRSFRRSKGKASENGVREGFLTEKMGT